MKAVILAGGFGKRLESVNKSIPKPMTLIFGKSVLEHQIGALKKEGITEFIFVVGYLSQQIEDYFGDGKAFGVHISYFREAEPLGTGGALFKLNLSEDFLLCNGDLIFDFDVNKMLEFHKKNNALATLFTHPNNHPFDSTVISCDENGLVNAFITDKKDADYQNLCNAGIQIISPKLLSMYSINGKANLDKDIIMPATKTKRIYSYKSAEYVHDMGTPKRLKAVERDFKNGTVQKKHSKNLQKAIFVDRDGTINKLDGFITSPNQIELIENTAEAIKTFHNLGYLVIVITNQPVIARGECSTQDLKQIHNRLEALLGNEGAFVDDIYYCPHHPDKGFEGEIKELKVKCECRKPSPGLLIKAKQEFNIDMSASFMVGDSQTDVMAAQNAGCIPVLLTEQADNNQQLSFNSLYDFSLYLLKETLQ